MVEERVERRLAAIFCADVAACSRPIGSDEEGTRAALRSHRRELIDPLITQRQERTVKTTGDGLLITADDRILVRYCLNASTCGDRADVGPILCRA
jgi:class 3 adenylate cyclase